LTIYAVNSLDLVISRFQTIKANFHDDSASLGFVRRADDKKGSERTEASKRGAFAIAIES